MVFMLRRLSPKAASVVAENYSSGTGNVWFRVLRSFAVGSAGPVRDSPTLPKQRKVGVFWDLDNKPPKNVSPFEAATRLLEMAAGFGSVVEAVAYANRHAFSHVPAWVHEERKQRKMLDELEMKQLVKPEELYVCGVCGAKKKTRVELTKHFRSLHEREQKKRMNRLESLKGKKKQKERFWDMSAEKISKYKEAAHSLILPKVGYGLMQDLRRAGLYVRTVQDKPQAADMALQEHMTKSMKNGVRCICLVSDDSDFTQMLKMARERNLHTVVVGDLRILSEYADTYFSWAEVASGMAEQKAKHATTLLMADFMNRFGDRLKDHRYKGFGFDEEDTQSESDTEFADEKGWRPHDRRVRLDDNPGRDFTFFSDDSSESDSDAEAYSHPKPRRLRSSAGDCKLGSEVPNKSRRGFSTERTVDAEPTAFTDIVSDTDMRASLPKGSRGPPVKTRAACASSPSTDCIPVTRFRASANSSTDKASPSCEGPSSRAEASSVANAESVNSIMKSFSDGLVPSSASEEERGQEIDRKDLVRVEDTNLDAGEDASGYGKVITGRGRKKKMFNEEDVDKQNRKILKEKAKHQSGGRSSEPVPFYMSGFASESQEDCGRINNWYFDFWRNDDQEEYRGRRISPHKKRTN